MLNTNQHRHIISREDNFDYIKKHLLSYDFNFTADILKLLGSIPKLKILLALTEKEELSIDEAAIIIGTSYKGPASHHLKVLKEIGFVKSRKEKRKLLYSIKSKQINYLIKSILELGRTS